MSGTKRSNVISKSLLVLRSFTDVKKEWGVNELARYIDMPVSSLHRILTILKDEGILAFSKYTQKYNIGLEMIRLSSIVFSDIDIKNIAKPFMGRLSETLNESIYLSLYHPELKRMSFIDSVHSSKNALQYVLEIGVLHSVHIASSGKSILSFLNDDDIESIIKEQNINEKEKHNLFNELQEIREKGYSFTFNERGIGAFGASAPIFDASQNVVGSLICVLPIKQFEKSKAPVICKQLKREAKEISYSLGYQLP